MNIFSYLLEAANWTGGNGILARLGEHLLYTAISVIVAAIIAIPLGILIGHTGRGNLLVVGTTNAARAIPTLGLLVLVIMLTTTGILPVVISLVVLAIPAILTATAAGVQNADREAVHAARGMGMTAGQVISKVEWPLALPLVISGVRSASLQVVATATVAAFVSSGGLGQLLITGQKTQDYPQMFAGAAVIAALAIILDIGLGALGWGLARRTRPKAKADRAPVPATA